MKKGTLWTIGYSILLTAFTVYISLDTFVLSSTYQKNATELNTSMFTQNESGSDSEKSSNDSSYKKNKKHSDTSSKKSDASSDSSNSISSNDLSSSSFQNDNVSITLNEYFENNTKIYLADIQVSSAEYLKTAFAKDAYGKNITEKTSEIASAHSAILAINGDYYGAQEAGYVIRNGIAYRNKAGSSDVLCIYADGSMKIIDTDEKTTEELIDEGVWQAFSFGPALVENQQISVSEKDEVGKAMASNPRTAIGIIDSCHYVFVVTDGRTSQSEGLSLYELAGFMQKIGVTTAYNLDGGGSSTMYFNGEVVNNPTTNGKSIEEREVSDIVYIG